MKQTFFRKFTAGVIGCALLLSVLGTPVAVRAETTSTLTEQLEALSGVLNSIGAQIAANPNMSDADRLSMMTQLVSISNQILLLRNGNYTGSYTSAVEASSVETDKAKDSADDAGLTRVKVSYDYKTNQAQMEVYYGKKVEKTTHTYTDLASISSFELRVTELKKLLATKISDEENIKRADILDLMQITGRDPLRDSSVTPNSSTAEYLFEKFGLHSIINKVEIRPEYGKGSIAILSDQGETLLLSLTQEVDSNGELEKPATYAYKYEFFIEGNSYSVVSFDDEDDDPIPIISQGASDITETLIKKYLLSQFNDIPFTSRISGFESKLLNFLVHNQAHYETSYTTVPASKLDCYYASDKVIVNEFIDYLVSGVAVQYEDLDSIKQYIAPIVSESDNHNSGECSTRNRMF